MIKFTSLASSSKGNAYLVEAAGVAPLLLEAGLPIKILREKLDFGLSNLAGCLVSHEHMDHAKAVKDLLKAGVDCYMSPGTAEALGVKGHHRVIPIKPGPVYFAPDIDTKSIKPTWIIKPFPLEHDAEQPYGFLIAYEGDRLLFIPDTAFVRERFKEVTTIAIECNHIGDILSENIQSGHLPAVVGRRVRRSHMSLETVITLLKANDLSRCRTIYLLHLSDANSDEKRMKEAVQSATGIPCEVC